MHSEHNTKMSLTNICGYCLAYIGTSPQDFTWKQWFVSGIAFTEHRGFILYWLPVERQREIHGNECSALFESYLRCRSWSQCHCFAENFFLLCPWWLSWWGAMDRNSSLRGPSSLLPLAVPFSTSKPRDPHPRAVLRGDQEGTRCFSTLSSAQAGALILCPCCPDLWHVGSVVSKVSKVSLFWLVPEIVGTNLSLNARGELQGHTATEPVVSITELWNRLGWKKNL